MRKAFFISGMIVSLVLPISGNAKEVGVLSSNIDYPIAQGIYRGSSNKASLYREFDFQEGTEEVVEETQEELNDADKSVIGYFKDKYEELKKYANSGDFDELKSKGRKLFIEWVDFWFYDGAINDFTLDKLTEEGKKEVNNTITGTIEFLDYYVPGFADVLNDKYTRVKEYLKNKSEATLEDFKSWIGEENYYELRDGIDNLGDGFKEMLLRLKKAANSKYEEFKTK